jgi:hypothetical protein
VLRKSYFHFGPNRIALRSYGRFEAGLDQNSDVGSGSTAGISIPTEI